jgi:hypothetical protein
VEAKHVIQESGSVTLFDFAVILKMSVYSVHNLVDKELRFTRNVCVMSTISVDMSNKADASRHMQGLKVKQKAIIFLDER